MGIEKKTHSRSAMEFDDEDNDSLSRTVELPIGESMSHGTKKVSSNLELNLHAPKFKSQIAITSESTSPTMHESGVRRASTPPVIVLSNFSTTTPLPISIPPSPNVIILSNSSINEMHAPSIYLQTPLMLCFIESC